MWLDAEAINAHFDRVRDRYKNQGSGYESVPDPSDLTQNELTKGLR